MFLTGQGETKDWTENHIFTSLMNYFGLSLFVVQKKKKGPGNQWLVVHFIFASLIYILIFKICLENNKIQIIPLVVWFV